MGEDDDIRLEDEDKDKDLKISPRRLSKTTTVHYLVGAYTALDYHYTAVTLT